MHVIPVSPSVCAVTADWKRITGSQHRSAGPHGVTLPSHLMPLINRLPLLKQGAFPCHSLMTHRLAQSLQSTSTEKSKIWMWALVLRHRILNTCYNSNGRWAWQHIDHQMALNQLYSCSLAMMLVLMQNWVKTPAELLTFPPASAVPSVWCSSGNVKVKIKTANIVNSSILALSVWEEHCCAL